MTAGRRTYTQRQLLEELEPVVAKELDRHLNIAKEWMPHEYVPWTEGMNFAGVFEDGVPWDVSQSKVSETARTALVVNLLTEDNLPSYHREIYQSFGPERRLGHVDRPLDRRGGPARHGHPRLPAHQPGRRPRRAGARAHGAHDAGLPELVRARHDAHRRLRELPGARHPDLAPQHRQVHRGPVRRPAARPDLGRREPAHGLLPQPHGGGARDRARPGDGGHLGRRGAVRDARARRSTASPADR